MSVQAIHYNQPPPKNKQTKKPKKNKNNEKEKKAKRNDIVQNDNFYIHF